MKVKSKSEVAQSCPTLSNPVDHSLPGSSVHGIFQARVLEWGAIVCDPMDYSPWNSPGQNTGVGSLSLLQGIFLMQGSNPGLSHARGVGEEGKKRCFLFLPLAAPSTSPDHSRGCLFQFWFPQDICLGVGFLGHMVVLFLLF